MGINQLFTVDALEEEPKDIDLGRWDPSFQYQIWYKSQVMGIIYIVYTSWDAQRLLLDTPEIYGDEFAIHSRTDGPESSIVQAVYNACNRWVCTPNQAYDTYCNNRWTKYNLRKNAT